MGNWFSKPTEAKTLHSEMEGQSSPLPPDPNNQMSTAHDENNLTALDYELLGEPDPHSGESEPDRALVGRETGDTEVAQDSSAVEGDEHMAQPNPIYSDEDHPMSNLWPEVDVRIPPVVGGADDILTGSDQQSEGNELFSEDFSRRFPWTRDIEPFEEDLEATPAESNSKQRARPPPPLVVTAEIPPAIAFVNSLPVVKPENQQADDNRCNICQDRYWAGELYEVPVSLPCNHVFGKNCLQIWFSDVPIEGDEKQHDSCPMCRRQYTFEKPQPRNNIDGLYQLLRYANYYLDEADSLRLSRERRKQWKDVQRNMTKHIRELKTRVQRERQTLFMHLVRREIRKSQFDTRIYLRLLHKAEDAGMITMYLANGEDDYNNVAFDEMDPYQVIAITEEMEVMATKLPALMDSIYYKHFAETASRTEGVAN